MNQEYFLRPLLIVFYYKNIGEIQNSIILIKVELSLKETFMFIRQT